jgi:hypothetical protein
MARARPAGAGKGVVSMNGLLPHVRRGLAALCAAAMLLPGAALAEEACGLCNKEVVTNAELADCFLAQYETLAAGGDAVIVVDLSQCESSRALAEALPSPVAGSEPALEPDFQFMVSRAQLDCLKRKLEEPGVVLDPSARIDLNSCG